MNVSTNFWWFWFCFGLLGLELVQMLGKDSTIEVTPALTLCWKMFHKLRSCEGEASSHPMPQLQCFSSSISCCVMYLCASFPASQRLWYFWRQDFWLAYNASHLAYFWPIEALQETPNCNANDTVEDLCNLHSDMLWPIIYKYVLQTKELKLLKNRPMAQSILPKGNENKWIINNVKKILL
jgi:hypothetical protein